MKKMVFLFCVLTTLVLVLAACATAGKEKKATPTTADPTGQSAASSNETYTVTFNTNGGGKIPAQSVQNGKRINKPDDPEKEDYKFIKWTYQGEEWSFAGYTVTGDMTLEAVWAPIWYTITYQIGIESSIRPIHYSYSVETPDFTIPDASRENYDFTGWTWEGQTEPVKNPIIPKGSRGDRVFTANWTPKTFTITYDLAGGTITNNPNPTTYTIESPDITLTGTPTWKDHVFLGWQFVTENGIYQGATLAHGSSGNKTVLATWGAYRVSGHTITGWESTGYGYSIEIPASINGVSITAIGNEAFQFSSGLERVIIPNSVKSIEEKAFFGCYSLTEITIPNSVTSIGGSAFSNCQKLTSVTIPNSLKSLENSVFSFCSKLTSITIPDSVTSIGGFAISDCENLTSVTIPGSVTSIGIYAISNCKKLTDIHFTGTKKQWNAISKGYDWNSNTGSYTVHCTDGDISK